MLISASAFGGIYKWTAADGEIIYSQTPPPSGIDFEYVEDPSTASTGNSSSQGLKNVQNQSGQAQPNRDQQLQDQQRLAESNQIKADNCKKAKQNLTNLTSRGQVTIKEGDLYRKLNEDERQAKIQESEALIQEFCN